MSGLSQNIKKMNIQAYVNIEPITIKRELTRGECLEFITEIDAAYKDVGFTLELIKILMKSVKGDLEDFEWNELLESFTKL
jgi:hypothetical protein